MYHRSIISAAYTTQPTQRRPDTTYAGDVNVIVAVFAADRKGSELQITAHFAADRIMRPPTPHASCARHAAYKHSHTHATCIMCKLRARTHPRHMYHVHATCTHPPPTCTNPPTPHVLCARYVHAPTHPRHMYYVHATYMHASNMHRFIQRE